MCRTRAADRTALLVDLGCVLAWQRQAQPGAPVPHTIAAATCHLLQLATAAAHLMLAACLMAAARHGGMGAAALQSGQAQGMSLLHQAVKSGSSVMVTQVAAWHRETLAELQVSPRPRHRL